jgi:hypothetical protein
MGGGPLPPKVLHYTEDLGHRDLDVVIDHLIVGQTTAFGEFVAALFDPRHHVILRVSSASQPVGLDLFRGGN